MKTRRYRHETKPPWPLANREEVFKPEIPVDEAGWEKLKKVKKKDFNDIVHGFLENVTNGTTTLTPQEQMLRFLDETPTHYFGGKLHDSETARVSLAELIQTYPDLRPEIIHGLLRRGEVMNVIAPPKAGKSWVALNAAASVIGGGKLFGKFQCSRGKVLIVDNELHCETIAWRGNKIAEAMHVPKSRLSLIDYVPLRGRLADLNKLEEIFEPLIRREYALIILDAFYKFYPEKFQENDNAMMAALYNKIDLYADYTDSAILLIHHSSKGSGAGKSVTDMGSGAGTQARAADAHLVLRQTKEKSIFIIDSANRSFKPVKPFCVRFEFPKWIDAPEHSAEELLDNSRDEYGNGGSKKACASTEEKAAKRVEENGKIVEFVMENVSEPIDQKTLLRRGFSSGFSPWNRDRIAPIIDEMLLTGKLAVAEEQQGSRPAKYVAAEKIVPSLLENSQECPDSVDLSGGDDVAPF